MSSESSSPVDAVLSDEARADLDGQDASAQERIQGAIAQTMSDPYPDGITKAVLGAPYPPNTLGFATPSHWIVYRFLNSATIEIMAILPWERFMPDAGH